MKVIAFCSHILEWKLDQRGLYLGVFNWRWSTTLLEGGHPGSDTPAIGET